jgi:hypothetical protein
MATPDSINRAPTPAPSSPCSTSFAPRFFFHPGAVANPGRHPGCTELEPNLRTLSDFVVRRLVPDVGALPFPLNEQLLMCGAFCRFAPAHLFAWGTHHGCSARIFFETAQAFSLPTTIHSIDLPSARPHGEHPGAEHAPLVKHLPAVRLNGRRRSQVGVGPPRTRRDPRALSAGDRAVARYVFLSPASGYNTGSSRAIREVLAAKGAPHRGVHILGGLPGMTLLHR